MIADDLYARIELQNRAKAFIRRHVDAGAVAGRIAADRDISQFEETWPPK